MPGFATHYLFGVNVLRVIKKKQQLPEDGMLWSIGQYKTVFQLGLQGPDVFFYHPGSNLRQKKPGSIVHEMRTGDFLLSLVQAAELFKDSEDARIAQAYAAGFIGHYVLDSQMHPYVYYRAACYKAAGNTKEVQVKKEDIGIHIALETDIDTCLLMRYAKCLPSEFCAGNTIQFDRHTRRVVAQVLYHAFAGVFPEFGFTKAELARAVFSIQTGSKLLYNPKNTKRQKAEWLEKKLFGHLTISTIVPCDELRCSEDPLNLKKEEWYNPWKPGKVHTESVLELQKRASGKYRKALLLLNDLYASKKEADRRKKEDQLFALLGAKSYHSGLS